MAMTMAMRIAMAKQQPRGGEPNYSNWEGMLKRLNPDGTYRSPVDDVPTDHPRPAPKRREPLKLFITDPSDVYDIDDRVMDISGKLILDLACEVAFPQGEEEIYLTKTEAVYNPEHVIELLDELKEYVESIDVALVLHSEYHLGPLLVRVLFNRYANIRAKAAELVTTMVQNNPKSQQFVVKVLGLGPYLYNFTSDPDATSRTKALGALIALVWNNDYSIAAFRQAKGYEALMHGLSSENDRPFQRDALNLIQYLLHENSSDCNIVTELGLPRIMMHLASSSDDAEVRVAALEDLLVLARGGDSSGQLVKNDDKLKQVLQERIEGISAMTPEDRGAAREEIQLVDLLWNVSYNEPSSLGEKGLLVLPGEDAPAPDVASKLFEPPVRAAEAADRNSVIEKDCNDLGLADIMIHLASNDDSEVREAALKGLLVLARGGDSGQLVKNDDKLKQVLQERIEGLKQVLGVAWREIQLVDSVWNVCYNEPSSLGEVGLLVLPGDNVRAPDVASKLFESPPRAWAAAEAADRNSLSEKEDPSAATLTCQSNSSSKRRKLNCLGTVLPSAATQPTPCSLEEWRVRDTGFKNLSG